MIFISQSWSVERMCNRQSRCCDLAIRHVLVTVGAILGLVAAVALMLIVLVRQRRERLSTGRENDFSARCSYDDCYDDGYGREAGSGSGGKEESEKWRWKGRKLLLLFGAGAKGARSRDKDLSSPAPSHYSRSSSANLTTNVIPPPSQPLSSSASPSASPSYRHHHHHRQHRGGKNHGPAAKTEPLSQAGAGVGTATPPTRPGVSQGEKEDGSSSLTWTVPTATPQRPVPRSARSRAPAWSEDVRRHA